MTDRSRGRWSGVATYVVLLAALSACAGPQTDGRSQVYRPGVPDFDLDVVAVPGDSLGAIETVVSIPRASLVFVRDSLGYRAVFQSSVSVSGASGHPPRTRLRVDTVRVDSYAATASFRPAVARERIPVPAGVYTARVEVEDIETGKTAVRELRTAVPGPADPPSVSALRLLGQRPGERGLQPLVALGVPSGLDSLQARFDVYGAPGDVVVRARVLRLRADTSVAEPPNAFTPPGGSLAARGLSTRRPDTVSVARQQIQVPDRLLTVEVPLPALDPGVYRIELDASRAASRDPFGVARRDVVVRDGAFPRLTTISDLVAPLVYLATPQEWRQLREATGTAAQREAFDAFWGSLFRERRRAEATLRAYFERVEEANRLFSTVKPGWSTDPGMVYVLFGPPERVEDRIDTQTWIYGPGQSAPGFVFERTAWRDRDSVPFDIWTLRRDAAYGAGWRRALRLWRAGDPP